LSQPRAGISLLSHTLSQKKTPALGGGFGLAARSAPGLLSLAGFFHGLPAKEQLRKPVQEKH